MPNPGTRTLRGARWISAALCWALLGVTASHADEVPAAASANEHGQRDIQILSTKLLLRAHHHIQKYEGFLPFGGALKQDGGIRMFLGEKPKSEKEISGIAAGVATGLRMIARQGSVDAVCLVVLVDTTPPGATKEIEAIWLRTEHVTGLSASVFYPYFDNGDGTIAIQDPYTVAEPLEFFLPPQASQTESAP